jgi:hypothetical protein
VITLLSFLGTPPQTTAMKMYKGEREIEAELKANKGFFFFLESEGHNLSQHTNTLYLTLVTFTVN